MFVGSHRYVAELNKWSGGLHQDSHTIDPCEIGAEDEDTCSDCQLSGSPSSGGSPQCSNGKSRRKKGKNKEKKVRNYLSHFQLLTKPKQVSMYASSRKRITESITTVPHILEVLEGLRSVHTRRQVAATCRGDALQRQIASCVLENFLKNFCGDKDFHKN